MDMDRPIILPEPVYRGLIRYCSEQSPCEACGLLLGSEAQGALHMERFVPVPNIAERPKHHFIMDPAALIPFLYPSPGEPAPAGIVHSHPRAAAVPSPEDLATPWSDIPSHWIVSLADPRSPVVRAYRYESGGRKYTELTWRLLRGGSGQAGDAESSVQ
ncbi:M67 family metallopeptidase [Paenibacillus doosanensis]|uniref:M67 family metallopeptidase n=1 Tax=Paenibacillus doosanensis TaxID=1229154 RepID=UPI00217FFEFC|nr:M67 family metallopeptidase [Paenibacillus doosanensis]MCS7460140.1 M67 family metallopeptidase [Paenibacillus doosanensis]